jgi:hypothetical protein
MACGSFADWGSAGHRRIILLPKVSLSAEIIDISHSRLVINFFDKPMKIFLVAEALEPTKMLIISEWTGFIAC